MGLMVYFLILGNAGFYIIKPYDSESSTLSPAEPPPPPPKVHESPQEAAKQNPRSPSVRTLLRPSNIP